MILPIVFMFSGQGAQYYGMAKKLYDRHLAFKETVDRLDAYAVDIIGESPISKLYDSEKTYKDEFKRTLYTHPAIFIIEYSLARLLISEGIQPSYVVGASLGEFAAAVVAGIIELEDALKAILIQAMTIEKHCTVGGMVAILHESSLYDRAPIIHRNSELVSVNHDSHFVVAGTTKGMIEVSHFLREADIVFQHLPVSYAFHSNLIEPASLPYSEYGSSLNCKSSAIPFVSCVTGKMIDKVWKGYFWDIARKPIRLREAVMTLETGAPLFYLDLGMGGTMANIAGRNFRAGSNSKSLSIITPFHKELEIIALVSNKSEAHQMHSERRRI